MPSTPLDRGVVTIRSAYDVPDTVNKLTEVLESHGAVIFARIDFSGDAARAGLTMLPEQMLIFGNPRSGTPLMQVEPRIGLDLPLKVLVWEDDQGSTWLAYNTPDYIMNRHGLPVAMGAQLAGALKLLEQFER
ncbi:DUF302 domain-containing protein [Dyella silvae]|uniref:DUF302 domain-containing protein n=1 Tax=Dyella silvae TaxID=2994424 RepID=UPI00226546F6|nr:DUF302 domain-containing protein [Dyella silvae]